ncbi:hypothetical protein Acid345_2330 [Candidatus Koribacter versatilis Ellin345]|uniref:Carboxypeptidase regulatory-like domain-containing protein n=1 Tax=Koribacter versatilis (strain Ellin345) TaxID=204669 RepID=Q1IP69_KORVE|nr:hypothetical protein [Candidatus Koribacter versatilis]ABF41331.1 hypothetical protein Acid345_2330 [Candidatus Koribacter versatilis Ellin345]
MRKVLLLFLLTQARNKLQGQQLSVMVVESRTGSPLANKTVELRFRPDALTSEVTSKTGKDGIAKFVLPTPPPTEIYDVTIPNSEIAECAALKDLQLDEVRQRGIISPSCDPKKDASLDSTSGVIVLRVWKLSLWQRLMRRSEA